MARGTDHASAVALQQLRAEHDELKLEVQALQRCLVRKGTLHNFDLQREQIEIGQRRSSLVSSSRLSVSAAEVPDLGSPNPSLGIIPSLRPRGLLNWAFRNLYESTSTPIEDKLCAVGGLDQTDEELNTAECFSCCSVRSSSPRTSVSCSSDAGGTWEAVPCMETARSGHAGALLGNWLYVCGGWEPGTGVSRSVVKFSPVDRERVWKPVTPMNVKRWSPVAVTLGDRLYVCGGYDGTRTLVSLERYHPDGGSAGDGAWEELPHMSQPRTSLAGVALREQLVVFGGSREPPWRASRSDLLRSVEAFDPAEAIWFPLRAMDQACYGHGAVESNGMVYVCGGMDGLDGITALQCFDPVANAWSRGPPMLRARWHHSAVVAAGCIYVCGGFVQGSSAGASPTAALARSEGETAVQSVDRFNLQNGSWEISEPMAQARTQLCAVALPAAIWDAMAKNKPSEIEYHLP